MSRISQSLLDSSPPGKFLSILGTVRMQGARRGTWALRDANAGWVIRWFHFLQTSRKRHRTRTGRQANTFSNISGGKSIHNLNMLAQVSVYVLDISGLNLVLLALDRLSAEKQNKSKIREIKLHTILLFTQVFEIGYKKHSGTLDCLWLGLRIYWGLRNHQTETWNSNDNSYLKALSFQFMRNYLFRELQCTIEIVTKPSSASNISDQVPQAWYRETTDPSLQLLTLRADIPRERNGLMGGTRLCSWQHSLKRAPTRVLWRPTPQGQNYSMRLASTLGALPFITRHASSLAPNHVGDGTRLQQTKSWTKQLEAVPCQR